MSTRPVREDQHGTPTGYSYGCRCYDCRVALREYGPHVSDEVVDRVFAALEHEADLDGISTASGERLGELAGVQQATAAAAVRLMGEQGRVKIARRVGPGGVLEVHIGGAS